MPTLDPAGEYLTRVWREVVYPMARRMDMPLRLPPVQPRSRLAHAAAFFAEGHGKIVEWQEQVFRAFFERGEDIGQPEVLVSLGRRIGLEEEALRGSLQSREFEAKVLLDKERAERLGIHAVPAYVVNGVRGVTGVRTREELQALVAQVGRPGK